MNYKNDKEKAMKLFAILSKFDEKNQDLILSKIIDKSFLNHLPPAIQKKIETLKGNFIDTHPKKNYSHKQKTFENYLSIFINEIIQGQNQTNKPDQLYFGVPKNENLDKNIEKFKDFFLDIPILEDEIIEKLFDAIYYSIFQQNDTISEKTIFKLLRVFTI